MWPFRKKINESEDHYDEDDFDFLLYNPDDENSAFIGERKPVIIEEPVMEPMKMSEPSPNGEPNIYIGDDLDDEPEFVPEKPQSNWKKNLLSYVHDVLYLLAALVVVSLVLRVVVVDGTSMNDTLKDGDYLLVLSNVFYRNPKQGDVIVASKDTYDNGAPIVKRVIATEGQTVDIDFMQGIVYVNGKALDEPYTLTPTNLDEGVEFPLTVPENCLFVLGDNRNGSKDSRDPSIGLIDKREVIGKVFFIFLPGTNGTDYAGNPKEPRNLKRIGFVKC